MDASYAKSQNDMMHSMSNIMHTKMAKFEERPNDDDLTAITSAMYKYKEAWYNLHDKETYYLYHPHQAKKAKEAK
jgi:hypothetical protein